MASKEPRDPALREAVRRGLMPADIAAAFDDWSDELATKLTNGEVTQAEAEAMTESRARADAIEAKRRGYPKS